MASRSRGLYRPHKEAREIAGQYLLPRVRRRDHNQYLVGGALDLRACQQCLGSSLAREAYIEDYQQVTERGIGQHSLGELGGGERAAPV